MKNKKNGEMYEHAYERTLVFANRCPFDATVVYVEGTNMKLSFKPATFGIAGGPIGTNTGVILTKENLLEIAGKMKTGAELRIAGCNELDIDSLKEEFKHYNNMEQYDSHSFKPKLKI